MNFKNLYIRIFFFCILSFLIISCGDDEGIGVDDWLGTYTGNEVTTQTIIADGTSNMFSDPQTLIISAGENKSILISENGGVPKMHSIKGSEANLEPILKRIEDNGWQYISGDITLDGTNLTIDFSYNITDIDDNPQTMVEVMGVYSKQ